MTLSNTRLQTPVSFPRDRSEWHHWLEGFVDVALEVRQFIESLPDTAITFKPADIDVKAPIPKIRKCCKLVGSWPVPDTMTNTTRIKWVNPNATHAHRYSDAVVKCACGTPMIKQAFSTKEPQPTNSQEHNNCIRPDRLEARAELLRNRIEIIEEIYEYGHTVWSMRHRLGLDPDSSIGTSIKHELGLDLEKLGKQSRQKVARTATVLLRNHAATTVGELFGMGGRAITEIVGKETTADPQMLYKHRRKYA